MSKLKPGEAAALLHAYKACPTHYTVTNTLVAKFQLLIEALATKISPAWRNDLVHEGKIALLKAAKKFPSTKDPSCFLNYAYKAVKRGMLYFVRTTVKKQPKYVESLEAMADNDNDKRLYQIPYPVDYVTSTTLSIDFKYLLNEDYMKKNHFTEREIKIFDMHFNKGYNVSEVAEKISLSVPQTSKLISKTKTKIQQLLAYTSNNNLN